MVYASAMFNAWSVLQNDLLVQSVAPPDKRGYWGGKARLVQNLTQCIAGVCWPAVLGQGTDRFSALLIVCGSVSIVAGLAYLPQYTYYIPPAKEKGITAEDIEQLLNVEREEFLKLTYEQKYLMVLARMEKGLPVDMTKYYMPGWEDDIHEELASGTAEWSNRRQAAKLLAFHQELNVKICSSRQRLEQIAMMMNQNRAAMRACPDRDAAKAALGKWLGDLLDHRGYDSWFQQPILFKTLLSGAFPEYAQKHEDEHEITAADTEAIVLGSMKVLDKHIDMNVDCQREAYFCLRCFFPTRQVVGSLDFK